MSEEQTEKMIQEKGLNAPRLRPEDIDAVIVGETYTALPGGKCMVCELTLANGFTVRGDAAAVSKENFNEDVGRSVSRKNARDKIWQLEGYLLQQRLHYAEGLSMIQERKYTVAGGKIVNRATGKAIPDDEPIMIFRAKDMKAIQAIEHYRELCADETHRNVVAGRIIDFQIFADTHPYRMSVEPDSDPSCLR